MFDPTIYENMKVVIEGCVYDLDLQGNILITDRKDLVDLSSMSRTYKIRFTLKENSSDSKKINNRFPAAEIMLHTELSDLASEILELKETNEIGCWLEVHLFMISKNIKKDGKQMYEILRKIWGVDLTIEHSVSYPLNFLNHDGVDRKDSNSYKHSVNIQFNRKINEEQIEDMKSLLDHTMDSLQKIRHIL